MEFEGQLTSVLMVMDSISVSTAARMLPQGPVMKHCACWWVQKQATVVDCG